jgi:2-succinyl-5-enolpyruvyl-6-hydroxy-3-cyclohexene-1-carboxylate synthase
VAIKRLAWALGWPLLADPLSQVRTGDHHGALVVSGYDNYLRDPGIARHLAPGMVLRFGAQPVSKPLFSYLERFREGSRQVLVTPDSSWRDPDLVSREIVHADAKSFCDALVECVGERRDNSYWCAPWAEMEQRTQDVIEASLGDEGRISEAGVFFHLRQVIPQGATIFAGNSMPVRDLDGFFSPSSDEEQEETEVRMYANRGASGIDGVVSSALGVAAAGQTVVLVIGDLSFYHDMNGLLAARRFGLNATIVLVNNDGGGIFSFLPQHDDPTHYEVLFGTPHGLDLSPAAQLYGLEWQTVSTPAQLREALRDSFERPGVQVIEVKTNREDNLRQHQELWRAVEEAARAPSDLDEQ